MDTAALTAALHALAHQLRDQDMNAMQSMGELQLNFGNALGASLEPLALAMAELDFEGALPHCQSLIESHST